MIFFVHFSCNFSDAKYTKYGTLQSLKGMGAGVPTAHLPGKRSKGYKSSPKSSTRPPSKAHPTTSLATAAANDGVAAHAGIKRMSNDSKKWNKKKSTPRHVKTGGGASSARDVQAVAA